MGSSCSNVGGQCLTPQSRTAVAGAAALEALHDKDLQQTITDPLRMLLTDRMLPPPHHHGASSATSAPLQTLGITELITQRAVVSQRDNNPLGVSPRSSRAASATSFIPPAVAVSSAGGSHYYPTISVADRSGLLRLHSDVSFAPAGFVSSSDTAALSQAPDKMFLWYSSRSSGDLVKHGGGGGAVARVLSVTSAPSLEGFFAVRSRSSRSVSCDESHGDANHYYQDCYRQQPSEASLKSLRRSTAANSTWGSSATAVADETLPPALALPMFIYGSK